MDKKELKKQSFSKAQQLTSDKNKVELLKSNVELKKQIAERKKVEKTLNLTEFAFAHAADIIFWIDKDGRLIDVNDTASNSLGYSRKELLTMKLWDIDSYFSEDTWPKDWQEVKQDSPASLESCLRAKDGHIVPIEARAIYMTYDNEEYIFASLRDITARKQAETALQESEARYHAIFNEAREGIVLIDLETGSIVDCNPEFERQTGRPVEELKKMKIWEIRPPDKIEMARQKFLEIKGAGTGGSTQLEFQKPDGEIVYIDFTSSKFNIGGHKYSHSLTRDITDRRAEEAKLQELYDEERRLRRKLEEQMRQRIEFTRALVHEIKTPLTSVLAASDLLASEIKEGSLHSLARHTYEGAYDLDQRVNELLDLARGEIGMLKLKCKSLNPKDLLHVVAARIQPEAEKRRQSLVLDFAPSLPHVQADEHRLQQVVQNLLSNALKFTPEGGTITLAAGRKNGGLVVMIRDTGPGISKEEQQRLFEPYHRLERDREHFSGLGLGLALCKVLVDLHGGEIWVESQPGSGSTFGFSLPSTTPNHRLVS